MMISLEEYLENPCAKLSIPYWKAKVIKIPADMKIVHDSEYSPMYLRQYKDERYFRLHRDLDNVGSTELDGFYMRTADENDIKVIVSVINNSYTDLHVSEAQIQGYTKTSVYNSDLWILAMEEETNMCAGCGIADFDSETGELILEWIQVLPAFRNKRIGQTIVNELLSRAKDFASFATVSGKADDPTKPEAIYRKCGFTGNDVWHIMRKCEK